LLVINIRVDRVVACFDRPYCTDCVKRVGFRPSDDEFGGAVDLGNIENVVLPKISLNCPYMLAQFTKPRNCLIPGFFEGDYNIVVAAMIFELMQEHADVCNISGEENVAMHGEPAWFLAKAPQRASVAVFQKR
jgi:hypothetical protein